MSKDYEIRAPREEVDKFEVEIKSTRKQVRHSEIYQRLMQGDVTSSDRYLLAALIKRMAKTKMYYGIVVFNETHYLDTDQGDPQNF